MNKREEEDKFGKLTLNENDLYGKSPYLINENIHFISNNYFQLASFYELIGNKFPFSSSYDDLCNYLNDELKPKIVLIFTRTLVRKQEFLKQKYYISNNTVLYKSFIAPSITESPIPVICVLVTTSFNLFLSFFNLLIFSLRLFIYPSCVQNLFFIVQ